MRIERNGFTYELPDDLVLTPQVLAELDEHEWKVRREMQRDIDSLFIKPSPKKKAGE